MKNEAYQIVWDEIVNRGLVDLISDRFGFKKDEVVLLESSSTAGWPTFVIFSVKGQGYGLGLANMRLCLAPAYGAEAFGEAV